MLTCKAAELCQLHLKAINCDYNYFDPKCNYVLYSNYVKIATVTVKRLLCIQTMLCGLLPTALKFSTARIADYNQTKTCKNREKIQFVITITIICNFDYIRAGHSSFRSIKY